MWIGYQEECAPTLKAAESGTNMVPSILCLNDQGGSVMECSEDVSGTLRAQEHGHQPLVFDNHGQDTRFRGPVGIAQTVSASFGEGGNNQPLVIGVQQEETVEEIRPVIELFENHGQRNAEAQCKQYCAFRQSKHSKSARTGPSPTLARACLTSLLY